MTQLQIFLYIYTINQPNTTANNASHYLFLQLFPARPMANALGIQTNTKATNLKMLLWDYIQNIGGKKAMIISLLGICILELGKYSYSISIFRAMIFQTFFQKIIFPIFWSFNWIDIRWFRPEKRPTTIIGNYFCCEVKSQLAENYNLHRVV